MNTKGMKFLAVLAVLAMAFAAFVTVVQTEESDAAAVATTNVSTTVDEDGKISVATAGPFYLNMTQVGKSISIDVTANVTAEFYVYAPANNAYTITTQANLTSKGVKFYIASEAYTTASPSVTAVGTMVVTAAVSSVYTVDTSAATITVATKDVEAQFANHTMILSQDEPTDLTTGWAVSPSTLTIAKTQTTHITYVKGTTDVAITYNGGGTGAVANGTKGIDQTVTISLTGVTGGTFSILTYKTSDWQDANPNIVGSCTTGSVAITGTGIVGVYNGSNAPELKTTDGTISAVFTGYKAETTSLDDIKGGASSSDAVYLSGAITNLLRSVYTAAVVDGTLKADLYVYGDYDVGDMAIPDGLSITSIGGSTGTLTVAQGTTNGNVTMNVTEFTGTIAADANVDSDFATLTYTKGTVSLISGNFQLPVLNVPADSTLIVLPSATLDLKTSAAVAAKGTFYLYGTLDWSEKSYPEYISNPGLFDVSGTFRAFSESEMTAKVKVTDMNGVGTVDFSSAMVPKIVEGAADVGVYYQMQNVVVQNYMNITNESTVYVRGTLTVPADTTLTVKKNSTLIIDSDTAIVTIAGELYVEEGAKFIVTDLRSSNITGAVEIEDGAKMYVGYTSALAAIDSATAKTGQVVFANGSELTVAGDIYAAPRASGVLSADDTKKFTLSTKSGSTTQMTGKIHLLQNAFYAEGRVILDEAVVDAASSYATIGGGAQVNIDEVTFSTNGLSLVIADGSNTLAVQSAGTTGITGLVLNDAYTKAAGSTPEYWTMDVSGTLDYTAADANPTVTLTGSKLTVAGELNLEEGVTLVIAGTMKVSGAIYAVNDNSVVDVTNANALVTVTGLIMTETEITTPTHLIAAYYKQKDAANKTFYYYTNLQSAIEAVAPTTVDGTKTITVYGAYNVDKNTFVPDKVVIDVNSAMTVGYGDKTVVMTFEDGSTLKGGNVTVYGTLNFENKKDNRAAVIYSDVAVIGTKASSYTNVYTALENADVGDVVKITSVNTVNITSDVTVKEGVELYAPAGTKVTVADGVTVTVNGQVTAYAGLEGDYLDETSPAVLVVNGIFKTGETDGLADLYDYYGVSGMYYTITDDDGVYNYISPLSIAVLYAVDAKDKTITAYGTVTSAPVVIEGTSDKSLAKIVIDASSSLEADLKLINATLTGNGAYEGTVALEGNAVKAVNVTGFVAKATDVLEISGTPVIDDVDTKASITILAGTVNAKGLDVDDANLVGFTVASGAEMDVYGTVGIETLVANGNVVVKAAKTQSVLTVEAADILGDLTVEAADSAKSYLAGKLVSDVLFIGIDSESAIAAVAAGSTVTGTNITATTIFLKAGSSITDSVVAAMKYSTFYVEDSLYMTVYTLDGTLQFGDIAVPKGTNALGDEWFYEGADASALYVKGGYSVYAFYVYDIYTVTIKTDAGIKAVSINGKVMVSPQSGVNVFQLSGLEAGTYNVTYTLMNGYEGTAQLYTADGTILKDNSFVLSGTDEDLWDPIKEQFVFTFQLSGTEQIIAPEPTPVEQNEWTITTILLVILVILIAVMAVIVALRLNRS